jgi:hypothetical protein
MQSIKSKRALAVSSALALVLTLGACTTDDDPDGTTDGLDGTTATTMSDLGGTTLPDTGTTAP